mmetsp:Transcript_10372/g.24828  ORF Transcript_10372/g.24828 Transcript_10372/m.24828 type:complete len:285 (-) Transcript_10372:129-983(-)
MQPWLRDVAASFNVEHATLRQRRERTVALERWYSFNRSADSARVLRDSFRNVRHGTSGELMLSFVVETHKGGLLVNQLESKTVYVPYDVQRPSLCPATALWAYYADTENLIADQRHRPKYLYLSTQKKRVQLDDGSSENAFFAVGSETLAKDVLRTLQRAGLDTTRIKAKHLRGLAASYALDGGAKLWDVMQQAGWRDVRTFLRHYRLLPPSGSAGRAAVCALLGAGVPRRDIEQPLGERERAAIDAELDDDDNVVGVRRQHIDGDIEHEQQQALLAHAAARVQ